MIFNETSVKVRVGRLLIFATIFASAYVGLFMGSLDNYRQWSGVLIMGYSGLLLVGRIEQRSRESLRQASVPDWLPGLVIFGAFYQQVVYLICGPLGNYMHRGITVLMAR